MKHPFILTYTDLISSLKIKTWTNKRHRQFVLLLLLSILSLISSPELYAEGSKDLYPDGATGNRAFLISMTGSYIFNPYTTLGRMYVYAEAGEKIYMGSSSQGVGNGTIKAYSPTGVLHTSGSSSTVGRIQNRNQELAGPSALASGGYSAYEVTVTETGIWVVEFYAQGTDMSESNSSQNTSSIQLGANAYWTATGSNNPITNPDSAFITAWDVTVAQGNTAISGRVYTNVFNLGMHKGVVSGQSHDGFFAKFYALTRDGYSYLIDNNGQNGLSFNTFVNNKGTIDPASKESTYKSFAYPSGNVGHLTDRFHDPRTVDDANNVTHKMFYN